MGKWVGGASASQRAPLHVSSFPHSCSGSTPKQTTTPRNLAQGLPCREPGQNRMLLEVPVPKALAWPCRACEPP